MAGQRPVACAAVPHCLQRHRLAVAGVSQVLAADELVRRTSGQDSRATSGGRSGPAALRVGRRAASPRASHEQSREVETVNHAEVWQGGLAGGGSRELDLSDRNEAVAQRSLLDKSGGSLFRRNPHRTAGSRIARLLKSSSPEPGHAHKKGPRKRSGPRGAKDSVKFPGAIGRLAPPASLRQCLVVHSSG